MFPKRHIVISEPRHHFHLHDVRGFSLVELMVSLAVVAVLLSLATPALLSVRASAKRAACMANLREFGVAIHLYRDEHDGILPYADRLYHIGHGWTDPLDALAPYLGNAKPRVDEQGVVHTQAPFRCPADDEIADESGFSYAYGPSAFMPSLTAFPFMTEEFAARLITLGMYGREPRTLWILADRDEWHPKAGSDDVSRKNVLRFDGAVGPARLSDITP